MMTTINDNASMLSFLSEPLQTQTHLSKSETHNVSVVVETFSKKVQTDGKPTEEGDDSFIKKKIKSPSALPRVHPFVPGTESSVVYKFLKTWVENVADKPLQLGDAVEQDQVYAAIVPNFTKPKASSNEKWDETMLGWTTRAIEALRKMDNFCHRADHCEKMCHLIVVLSFLQKDGLPQSTCKKPLEQLLMAYLFFGAVDTTNLKLMQCLYPGRVFRNAKELMPSHEFFSEDFMNLQTETSKKTKRLRTPEEKKALKMKRAAKKAADAAEKAAKKAADEAEKAAQVALIRDLQARLKVFEKCGPADPATEAAQDAPVQAAATEAAQAAPVQAAATEAAQVAPAQAAATEAVVVQEAAQVAPAKSTSRRKKRKSSPFVVAGKKPKMPKD